MEGLPPSELGTVLLIESGPRAEGEKAIAYLYECGAKELDILTCFPDAPKSFHADRGALISVHSQEARTNRKAFVRDLCSRPYNSVVVLTVGSGVLRNWKLVIAFRTFKRLVLLDRDLEFVSLRRCGWKTLVRFLVNSTAPIRNADIPWDMSDSVLARACEIAVAPFQLGYLVLYTISAHLGRLLRIATRRVPQ
jgi:hypothetical protein